MNAQFKAKKLASGLGELPGALASTSYQIISEGERGLVARPDNSPGYIVKAFSEPNGENACSHEFETIDYALNTSAKPLQSFPVVYAQGHLAIGSKLLPAIAMQSADSATMREMGYGRLIRSGVPKAQSARELLALSLSLANTLHELRAHYIHLRVRTPDAILVRWGGDGTPKHSLPRIKLSDVMSLGFSSPASSGQCDQAISPLPFTPPELMVPDEDFDWPSADPVDVWVYGSLVCYAAVGRFWDKWMDGRDAGSLRSADYATARSLKRPPLDLRSLAPDYFARPGELPLAECVADVIMACTNAEPSLRPDIVSVRSVLEAASGVDASANNTMPFRHRALK